MKTKEEQIKAILSWNTFRWACEQLSDSSEIDQKKYADFISVTAEEICEFVRTNGFDDRAVFVCSTQDRWDNFKSDDHLCICEEKGGWIVFYTERGQRSAEARFSTREQAEAEIVRRLIVSAKVSLNHRYKNAHPDLNLPKPSEMY